MEKYEDLLEMLAKNGCLPEFSESVPQEVKTLIMFALDGDWHSAENFARVQFEKQQSAQQFMKSQTLAAYASEIGYHTEDASQDLPELPEGF